LCADDKHFFRSDPVPVTEAFARMFRVFRDTILELQPTTANACFGLFQIPSAIRRGSTGSTKVAELTRCCPISSLTSAI
jgi:hypothetical protein